MARMKRWVNLTDEEKIERWERGVKVLQKLPAHVRRKHWQMNIFGKNTECGTVACAAGHIGMDPWFRARGLSLTGPNGRPLEKCAVGQEYDIQFEDKVCDFFGDHGAIRIFWNGRTRSVTRVIFEMKRYIELLKVSQAYHRALDALRKAEHAFEGLAFEEGMED